MHDFGRDVASRTLATLLATAILAVSAAAWATLRILAPSFLASHGLSGREAIAWALVVALSAAVVLLYRAALTGRATDESAARAGPFDCRAILTEVRQLYLAGLTRAEPFIQFGLVIENASGRTIEISDIRGRVNILGEEPGTPPTLELWNQRPLVLSPAPQSLAIRQSVTPEHANLLLRLLQDRSIIAFSLVRIELVGKLDNEPLPPCPVYRDSFRAKGPIDLLNGDGNIIKLDGLFVSQQVYNGEGDPVNRPAG